MMRPTIIFINGWKRKGRRERRTCDESRDEMAYTVEKEEFTDHEGLDEHHKRCGNHGEQAHDVASSDDIEDGIAWTGQ